MPSSAHATPHSADPSPVLDEVLDAAATVSMLQRATCLALLPSAVDAECAASMLAGYMWAQQCEAADEAGADGSPALAATRLLAGLLERVADQTLVDAALSMALQLRTLDPDDMTLQREASALAIELRVRDAVEPAWSGREGQYEVTRCWVLRDEHALRDDLFLGFRDADGDEHTVTSWGTSHARAMIANVQVQLGIDEVIAAMFELGTDPGLSFEPIAPAGAVEILEEQVAATIDGGGPSFLEPEGLGLWALLRSRSRTLREVASSGV